MLLLRAVKDEQCMFKPHMVGGLFPLKIYFCHFGKVPQSTPTPIQICRANYKPHLVELKQICFKLISFDWEDIATMARPYEFR